MNATANKIHITPDGEPIKCSCGCREFKESIIDITANVVCERESNCTSCGRQVGYWGYGNWMIEPDDDRLVVTE